MNDRGITESVVEQAALTRLGRIGREQTVLTHMLSAARLGQARLGRASCKLGQEDHLTQEAGKG